MTLILVDGKLTDMIYTRAENPTLCRLKFIWRILLIQNNIYLLPPTTFHPSEAQETS